MNKKLRTQHKMKIFTGNCPICNQLFSRRNREVIANLKQNKAGPFCSKRCAGLYSTNKQYKLKLIYDPITIEI